MQKYGKLTFIREAGRIKEKNCTLTVAWECRCDCGTIKVYRASSIKSGNTRSCGCAEHKGGVLARFNAMWEPVTESGCWIWTGGSSREYGVFSVSPGGGKRREVVSAHRMSWILTNGPIPEGLHVCHKCDVTLCVNPNHLFLGTPKDNMRDKINKGRAVWLPVVKGEDHYHSKLTNEQVLQIRDDGRPYTVIAAELGVTSPAIGSIKRGTTWKHLLP